MKRLVLFLLLIVLFSACKYDGSENSPLYSSDGKPQLVPLNTNGGFKFNQFSNDSIQTLINAAGEIVISGKTQKLSGKIIERGADRKRLKASPVTRDLQSNFHLLPGKLNQVPYDSVATSHPISRDSSDTVLLNSIGETVTTGVKIPVSGRKIKCLPSPAVRLLALDKKDLASKDFASLDMEQGLSSSYILAIDTDQQGNLWLGTLDGGVIKYDGKNMIHLGLDNGLLSNEIWAILSDSKGNIWFGSKEAGACRYDGDSLSYFTEKEGLAENHVLSIFEDSKGNIWFGTNGGGASCFDGSSLITYSKKESLSNIVIQISEDRAGNIWFSSYNEGVFKFDGASFTQYTVESGLANNSVMPILEDRHGNLWFGTWGGGISVFDGTQFVNYTKRDGLCDNNINALAEDMNGNIWIGSWEGISKFDGSGFTNFSTADGLTNNDIRTILTDKYHNIWMGSWGGGLMNYRTNSFLNLTDREGLSHSHVSSILEDSRKNLWFGTWNGLTKQDDNKLLSYTLGTGQESSFGSALAEDLLGNLWIGTENGGLIRFDGQSFEQYTELVLPNNLIYQIVPDDNGNLWIATERSGLVKFDGKHFELYSPDTGFPQNTIHMVLQDSKQNIWVATAGAGLAKISGDSVTYYTEKEGLSSNNLNTLFEDASGRLLIGTEDAGLCVFDGSNFSYYSTTEGMSSNNIRSIAGDAENRIWIGTNKGLNLMLFPETKELSADFRSDSVSVQIVPFGIEDGLKALDFNINSIYVDSENRLWMGTGKCLSMLDLNTFEIDTVEHKAFVAELDVKEKFIDFNKPGDELKNWKYDAVLPFLNVPVNPEIPFSYNHLIFHFSINNFASKRKVFYSYRIKELHLNWSNPSTDDHADYRNLPPGPKTLEFRAVNLYGIPTASSTYSFRILPPWYQTITAKLSFSIVLLWLVFIVIKIRTSALIRRKNDLLKIVAELEIAKQKAEESDRLKSAFLLNLSHEIRTPMNGILGFTDLLREKGLSGDTQEKYIDVINRSGIRMMNTVQDLIEISKAETGQLSLSTASFSLFHELYQLCKLFQQEVNDKGLVFDYSAFEVEEDMQVNSDLGKLKGIFDRLLKNAIKYTSSGEIKVGFRQIKSAENKIEFFVSDTGIGIPEDRVSAIFVPFVQADIEDKKAYQGTGIGLSIVKAYVDVLGGLIWVHSENDKGSTFYFVLTF